MEEFVKNYMHIWDVQSLLLLLECMSIFKLKFGKWVTENRFKELAVSLYNSYCKITWIRVNYSKERLIRWRWWKFRKQSWSTSEQLMPSSRLKVFLLFICSLSFVWFVWSKSHSRNQVKTKFVGELYQFTAINLQVYFFHQNQHVLKDNSLTITFNL